MGLIFIISALTLFLWDCYISFVVIEAAGWWWKVLVFLPSTFFLIEIIYVLAFRGITHKTINLTTWLTLLIFFPTYIFSLVSVVGFFLSFAARQLFDIFNWIGLGITTLWIVVVLYGILIGWKRVIVRKVSLSYFDLPRNFNGYKIIHLSDLHIGTYASSPSTVAKIVEKVNSLEPDLIAFTGDLVNNSASEIIPFIEILKKLKAKDGIISVLGNHDYCLYRSYVYPDSAEKELKRLIELEKESGWKLLLNSSLQIERGLDRIAVIGVENAGGKSFTDRADLKLALSEIPNREFKILLSHDPSHWRREIVGQTDINLTLSGHTHAMQFKIGKFSPAKWAYKEWGGVYSAGDQKLVVNTGTGGNVAFRLGAYPEILEITLRNNKS